MRLIRSRRLTHQVTLTSLVVILTGTVHIQASAQQVVDQIKAVSETVTELTNNINLIGALIVVIGALLAMLMIDRWRSSNALHRAEIGREKDAAKYYKAVDAFTKIAKADQYNKYYYNNFLKALVVQLKANQIADKKQHEELRSDFDSFKNAQAANLEAFGGRITKEIANGLNAFGELHRKTMLEVAEINRKTQLQLAAKQAEDEQRVVKATIATLQNMGVQIEVPPPAEKPATGSLQSPTNEHLDIE